MKIAVTGATGFIGRHVVPVLLKQGVEVIAAARKPELVFSARDGLTLSAIDMRNPTQAASALGDPDVLVHLAWGGLPNYSSDVHLLDELPRQMAFLDACRRSGLKHLVVAGTCLEYGKQEGELNEAMQTIPSTAYGQAKTLLHQHLSADAAAGATQLSWLRLFYLYGEGQAKKSLYTQILNAARSGSPSVAMSPGDQVRDFLPIGRAAEMIGSIALRGAPAGTVNVCSGKPVSVAEIAQSWISDMGANVTLDLGTLPYAEYEPHKFWGSTKKLTALLEAT